MLGGIWSFFYLNFNISNEWIRYEVMSIGLDFRNVFFFLWLFRVYLGWGVLIRVVYFEVGFFFFSVLVSSWRFCYDSFEFRFSCVFELRSTGVASICYFCLVKIEVVIVFIYVVKYKYWELVFLKFRVFFFDFW